MIEIIKELDVEVTKPNIFQALVAKQYDMNTRFLKVTLKDCGKRIDVPLTDTTRVIINAERKDGESKGFDGVINKDGTVTVPLHSWMLELDGTVICDISVVDTAEDNGKRLTTTSFTLLVEKAAYGSDDMTSDPQYNVLVSLLETCSTAGAVAEEALQKSNEANLKYEACVEATGRANEAADNANAVRENVEAGGYIESLKELNNGEKFTFWVGTKEEYDALTEIIPNCFYITGDVSTQKIENMLNDIENRLQVAEHNLTEQRNNFADRKYFEGAATITPYWETPEPINFEMPKFYSLLLLDFGVAEAVCRLKKISDTQFKITGELDLFDKIKGVTKTTELPVGIRPIYYIDFDGTYSEGEENITFSITKCNGHVYGLFTSLNAEADVSLSYHMNEMKTLQTKSGDDVTLNGIYGIV